MKQIFFFIFTSAIILNPTMSLAQQEQVPSFCKYLEGIPLPFCKVPSDNCASGQEKMSIYFKWQTFIEPVVPGHVNNCPSGDMVCTYTPINGPDGSGVEQNCECRNPIVQPPTCRTDCLPCTPAGGQVDYGIKCQLLCDDPPSFPGVITHSQNSAYPSDPASGVYGPSIGRACPTNPVSLCPNGGGGGGPTNMNECPVNSTNGVPFQIYDGRGDKCCYYNPRGQAAATAYNARNPGRPPVGACH